MDLNQMSTQELLQYHLEIYKDVTVLEESINMLEIVKDEKEYEIEKIEKLLDSD